MKKEIKKTLLPNWVILRGFLLCGKYFHVVPGLYLNEKNWSGITQSNLKDLHCNT